MPTYHFGQDLLDTYQSMSTFMQLAWLVVPFVAACVIFALFLYHMRKSAEADLPAPLPEPSDESRIYKMMYKDIHARIMDGRINREPGRE